MQIVRAVRGVLSPSEWIACLLGCEILDFLIFYSAASKGRFFFYGVGYYLKNIYLNWEIVASFNFPFHAFSEFSLLFSLGILHIVRLEDTVMEINNQIP